MSSYNCQHKHKLPPDYVYIDKIGSPPSQTTTIHPARQDIRAMVKGLLSEQPMVGTRSINSLPVETLSHIFILVCNMRPCPRSGAEPIYRLQFKRVPVVLSQVCSFWRRVAVATRYLWTHIDLVLGHIKVGTEVYLARAGETPLHIHILRSPSGSKPGLGSDIERDNKFIQFLVANAPRAWGLTIEMSKDSHPPSDQNARVLSSILGNCVPGILTHFSLNPEASSEALRGQATLMGEPDATKEALWLPVTVLRLENYFPDWNSKIYCGLTEMRLSGRSDASMSDSEMVAILRSSPRLRVLQTSIKITNDTPGHKGPITRVFLEDLEILSLGGWLSNRFALMKLIQPGPKPLALTMDVVDSGDDFTFSYIDNPKDFFTRSNVTKIIVIGLSGYTLIPSLLSVAPTVRTLALHKVLPRQRLKDESVVPSSRTLDSLYVTHTRDDSFMLHTPMIWPLVEHVIRRHSIPRVTLWACEIGEGFLSNNTATGGVEVTVLPDEDIDPIQGWM